MTKTKATLGLAIAMLVAAPAVIAQTPSPLTAYGGQAGSVQGQLQGQAAGGTLPFTGSDLTFLAVAAAMLLVGGILLRRFARTGQ